MMYCTVKNAPLFKVGATLEHNML